MVTSTALGRPWVTGAFAHLPSSAFLEGSHKVEAEPRGWLWDLRPTAPQAGWSGPGLVRRDSGPRRKLPLMGLLDSGEGDPGAWACGLGLDRRPRDTGSKQGSTAGAW